MRPGPRSSLVLSVCVWGLGSGTVCVWWILRGTVWVMEVPTVGVGTGSPDGDGPLVKVAEVGTHTDGPGTTHRDTSPRPGSLPGDPDVTPVLPRRGDATGECQPYFSSGDP